MSALRRAGERPRVTIVVVLVAALALAGAGFLGAALAGGDEAGGDAAELASELEAERARSLELETQLTAALRRIEDMREAQSKGDSKERRRSGSPGGGDG
jgi:hypothetical protein